RADCGPPRRSCDRRLRGARPAAAARPPLEAACYNLPPMLQMILAKVIGTKNEREMKRLVPLVARISELEAGVMGLSDADLAGKTPVFRTRVENGEPLEELLPEAFAVVREAG